MTDVYLVRHGQAQTGAQSEESYDSLSTLGHRQAEWLGEHLAGSGRDLRRIVSGDLIRQQETARHLSAALGLPVKTDRRLREIDYFGLAASMRARRNSRPPANREEFLSHFPELMADWAGGTLETPTETFAAFQSRVLSVLEFAEAHPGTVLVTSGGVIGMTMRHVLGLGLDAYSHVILQIHNASLHHYQIEAGGRRLVSFNGTPQLDAVDRAAARTFV